MTVTDKKPGPSRTAKRSKYARARVKAGQTYNSLRARGFGQATIQKADNGTLPSHPLIRAAYLAAIGLTEKAKAAAHV